MDKWDWPVSIAFAVMTVSVFVLLAVTIFTVNPWLVLLVLVWFGFIWANWREFSKWRSGNHKMQRETQETGDRFSIQIFLAASAAADHLSRKYQHLGATDSPEVRDHLRAIWEEVAAHRLPESTPKEFLELRSKATRMVVLLSGQEELH